MHLPEGSLLGGGLRRFGGQQRVRVDIGERQMAPDVADVGEVAEQLAHDGFRLPAVGALEVAVLDNRDVRLKRPADVVALQVDVDIEIDHLLSSAEERTEPRLLGKERCCAKQQPGEQSRAQCRAQDPDLRLLEPRVVEGDCRY